MEADAIMVGAVNQPMINKKKYTRAKAVAIFLYTHSC